MNFFKFMLNFILVIIFVILLPAVGLVRFINSLRNLMQKRIYYVARDVGSIPYARGNIFVYDVLLKGKDSKDFSKREKQIYIHRNKVAFNWLINKARGYGVNDLKINVTLKDLTKFKIFHKMHIPTWRPGDEKNNNSKKWLKEIAYINGYSDIKQFYQALKNEKYQGSCVIMFFDPKFKVEYSFAMRAYYVKNSPSKDNPEWAVVHFCNNPLVITHEFLHLAGADDLYNKKIPSNFCYSDIFNHIYDVDSVTICKLTAFSIGWINVLPYHDGLKIKDYSTPEDIQKRRNGND